MSETIVLLSHYEPAMPWLLKFLKQKKVKRIAVIIDAKTPRLKKEPGYKIKEASIFKKNGFDVSEVTLEDTKEVLSELYKMDAIYLKGGNTFYLLNAIRKSGLDKAIKVLLSKGIIYVGESAGSYVACPTIEMAHWKHQDEDVVGLDDLTALNLVPFLVTAHYTDDFKEAVDKGERESKYMVARLTDNDFILIENGKVEKRELTNELN